MTSPVINLARECGALVGVKHATDCDGEMIIFAPEELTRFYALAQAQALRGAAMSIHPAKALTQQDLMHMAEQIDKAMEAGS